jgi:hypothetical protein
MASSIVVTIQRKTSKKLCLKLACTAHTDGTFDSKQILASETGNVDYWAQGYILYEAWSVNPHTGYPTVAAAVTLVDEQNCGIIQSGELTLSTSADGVVEAGLGKFRTVRSKLTIAIGDTGTAANTVDIYLVFTKEE